LGDTGQFLVLDSEHTHLYKLFGMGLPAGHRSHDGDIDTTAAEPTEFRAALLRDLQVLVPGSLSRATYPFLASRRLVAQWPVLSNRILELCDRFERLLAQHPTWELSHVFRFALYRLAHEQPGIDIGYYDLSGSPSQPEGPPTGRSSLFEEPPFVIPRGLEPATPHNAVRRPLLLKASIDAYRIPLLTELFPDQDIRIIHLTRNPAASINGLMDGWKHWGFFSHELSGRTVLDIDGYSRHSWAKRWWNFDLPPCWQEYTRSNLSDVCALQWTSAHEHILTGLATTDLAAMRVKAEDIVTVGANRNHKLRQVLEFCGAKADIKLPAIDQPIMTTAPPRPARWRQNAAALAAVLSKSCVRTLADALGYGHAPNHQWI
jgi:hypothetical protein